MEQRRRGRLSAGIELFATGLVGMAAVMVIASKVAEMVGGNNDVGADPAIADEWEAVIRDGLRVGPDSAPIVVVEFVDFQCPACAGAAPALSRLLERNADVALVLHHFPLMRHPEAVPAAIAVECAARQGKTRDLIQALFAKQDSLGLRPLSSFAAESGIPDEDAFERCLLLPTDSFPRIARGRELGAAVGVTGTPTFWVNRRRAFTGQLESRVEAVRAREKGFLYALFRF